MVPMTMPAMAPPERPLLEVEPVVVVLSDAWMITVVVGCWRARRRETACGRVGVGAMVVAEEGCGLLWLFEILARGWWQCLRSTLADPELVVSGVGQRDFTEEEDLIS